MKRMLSLFMAVAFSLSTVGFACAAEEVSVIPDETVSVIEEAAPVSDQIQTAPVADKAEKKTKKKSAKKTEKKKRKKEGVSKSFTK